MLRLALLFLVISLVAALFGFGGISAAAADIARILFFIFIVIFLVLLVAGLMAGSTLFENRLTVFCAGANLFFAAGCLKGPCFFGGRRAGRWSEAQLDGTTDR